ncbi:uncharacterized protein LOC131673709 [Phymastichus coffea]|uniref:uncharacterized protein LOC131673709 n=1 Tax=Phymastichus coffea TaxID=108790 RepID=UPI00273A827D|nr:uncharacterized protein LOC131673709 [Phymastichus coffea]
MDTTSGTRSATGQPPHSSSVLMNLLVSGCDMQAIQEELQCTNSSVLTAGSKQRQQHKISELHIQNEDQVQTVPQWTNSLNSDSMSSINSCSPIHNKQTNYDPLSYDNELNFINSTDMLQDNELFSALDSTLL